jgi:hypothetical protein
MTDLTEEHVMRRALPLLLIAGVLAAPLQARAQAPPYLPVQGVLYDSAGTPVDGDVVMTFSIYNTEIAGTALWSELQVILVEDGFYTAYLGEGTVLDLAMFRDNTDLWLGITVEGDSEMPRVYLGSTPYTGFAQYCGNIPDHGHDFTDLTGTLDPGALPGGVVVGAQTCTGTDKVSGVDATGAVVCTADTDTDTTYTAGTGLALTGTRFDADMTFLQQRVTGACSTNQAIRSVNSDGTVTCQNVYTGDITGVTAGTGMTGGGVSGSVTLNVDTSYLQRRVSATCGTNSAIRAISSTGTVTCQSVYTGDITGVTAGTGIVGGGTAGAVTVSADTAYLQRRVVGTCAAGSSIRIISSTGTVTCEADDVGVSGGGDITAVYAGTGLSGGGTTGAVTLSADTTYLQRRVTGTCGTNQAIRVISSTGTVTCQSVYTGDITGVTAGTGLSGGGTTGSVTLSANTTYLQRRVSATCAAGSSIRVISSTGTVTCETDDVGSGGGTAYGAVSNYTSSTLVSGANHIFPSTTSVTIPSGAAGVCMVNMDVSVWTSAANASSAPFVRTARRVGATDTNDGQYGFYLDESVTAGSQTNMSRSHAWTGLSVGTTYQFGCYIYGTGDFIGDTGYCRVSLHCW